MAFDDLEPTPLNTFKVPERAEVITPGGLDVELGSDAPSFADTLKSAFRQDNIVGSFMTRQDANLPTNAEEGFDAWAKIKETPLERYWDRFLDIHNQRAFDMRLAQIKQEEEDRRTLATAPWYKSVPAQLAAGVFDPTNLLPAGYVIRSARGGISIARTAAMSGLLTGASATAQEAALQSMQQTRTAEESAMGIGTSVLLGALLGAGGAKLLDNMEWRASQDAMDRALANEPPPPGSTAARAEDADFLREYFAQQNAVLDKAESDLAGLKSDLAVREPAVTGEVSAMPGEAAPPAATSLNIGTAQPQARFGEQGQLGDQSVTARMSQPQIEKDLGFSMPGTLVKGSFNPAGELDGMFAWHGSPHDFDTFDLSKIGTGEGAQGEGHGLYFAQKKNVAEKYAEDNTVVQQYIHGREFVEENGGSYFDGALYWLDKSNGNADEAVSLIERAAKENGQDISEWQNTIESVRILSKLKPTLYQTRLNVSLDKMIDLDKSFSDQSQYVLDAFRRLGWPLPPYDRAITPSMNMRTAWKLIVNHTDMSPEKAAAELSREGVDGVQYFDAMSRDERAGTKNFVIFDDNKINIVGKNGKMTPIRGQATGQLSETSTAAINAALDASKKIRQAESTGNLASIPQATESAKAASAVEGGPAGTFMFDPTTLKVDAKRFQFKEGGNEQGVTTALKGVTKWDRAKGNQIIVWQDKGGDFYVVDGHQRSGLARRLIESGKEQNVELPGLLYREADGVSAEDARSIAAAKNISEGSGSALDGAKVLRSRPDLLDGSMPLSTGKARQAAALAKLDDEAFRMIVNEVVPEHMGAIVGERIPNDGPRQIAAIKAIAKFKPENETQAAVLVQRVSQAELAKAEEGAQASMFGDLESADSTAGEEMKIVGRLIKELQKDKTLFTRVVANANRIEETGSNIERASAKEVQTEAELFARRLASDAYSPGPLRDELVTAARDLKNEKIQIGEATARIRSALRRAAEDDVDARSGNRGRVEPTVAARQASGESISEPVAAGESLFDDIRPAGARERDNNVVSFKKRRLTTIEEVAAHTTNDIEENLAAAKSEEESGLKLIREVYLPEQQKAVEAYRESSASANDNANFHDTDWAPFLSKKGREAIVEGTLRKNQSQMSLAKAMQEQLREALPPGYRMEIVSEPSAYGGEYWQSLTGAQDVFIRILNRAGEEVGRVNPAFGFERYKDSWLSDLIRAGEADSVDSVIAQHPDMDGPKAPKPSADVLPMVEPGAEGKPQLLMEGVEPVTDKEKTALKAGKPLKAKAEQKEPGGIFDEANTAQEDMLSGEQEAPDLGGQTNFSAKPGSVSAAAVLPASLEGNSIAGKAAAFLAYISRFPTKAGMTHFNPLLRALHSPSAVVRDIMLQVVENPLYLNKNLEGVASEASAETLMKQWDAGLTRAVEATTKAYSEYRKAGGRMTNTEFREAVGKAMRRGDTSADPAVERVAKDWRKNVFDPLKDAAINAGLLPEGVTVETATSYFSRMWNRQRLIAQEDSFKQIVRNWINASFPGWQAGFDRETAKESARLSGDKLRKYQAERIRERERLFGIEPGEVADTVADEVFDTLVGRLDGGARPELVTIKARGPLAERTFNIPDELVEDFLVHDILGVGARYSRIMRADVELANKFGAPDMKEQINAINAHYKQLSSLAKTEAERTALEVSRQADIADVEAMRDIIRGTGYKLPHLWEKNFDHISRLSRHYNYIRSMGEAALASLSESVRPAMVHGLMPFMSTVGKLATNLEGIKLSLEDAKAAGNISERVLGHRIATLMEISDPYASKSPVESMLDNLTSVASVWNGIRLLTDWQKSVAAVMTQDRILKGVTGYDGIKDSERAYLAYLGVNQSMAERIAEQYTAHGLTVDGVRVAKTERWTDEAAKRAYYAAMNKDVDSIITTRGVADVPLFANTPVGAAMLQFRTFALAAHQRVLLRGLQEDQARFLGGIIAMTTIGMMVTYLKAVSGNRQEKLADFSKKPGWWISEGLDRAGVLAGAMEVANAFEKATSVNPIKSPLQAFDEGGRRESQRIQNRNLMGALAGPTVGLVEDIGIAAGIPAMVAKGQRVTRPQKNAAERLVPFSSYPFVRQMLRYTINPQD